ncbi:DUF7674 family protein [Edaphobacter bradus]|uniref:DUF7674 family protein n=1 Tax=Edaphobacter bradus TaxID=2259016 RepID=UPI0021E0A6DD|nr:hypothetical protein [Edaphobacter bradus]
MNFETVVTELFTRFPKLQATYRAQFDYMGDETPAPYMVFGSVLVPALTQSLEAGDLSSILPLCAFLEDVAEAARKDNGLRALLEVEVGEWLGWAANENLLAPWLGPETKRICGYVPGLATQRRLLQAEKEQRSLRSRLKSKFEQLWKK